MEYIVSRNYKLPQEKSVFENGPWFNVYKTEKWPYNKLEEGDILYFYESKTKRIVWKARVTEVLRQSYINRSDLPVTYQKAEDDNYFEKKSSGFLLAYKVKAIGDYSPYPKETSEKMDLLGWMKVDGSVKKEWGLK